MFLFFLQAIPPAAAPPTISQAALYALVVIFGALPTTVDDWVKKRVTDPLKVVLYTGLVALAFATLGAACTQVADGATWDDSAKVAGASLIAGAAACVVNYLHARAAANGSSGGGAAAIAARVVAVIAVVVLLTGCKDPATPAGLQADEETVRADLALFSRGVLAADDVCEEAGRILVANGGKDDAIALLTKCRDEYNTIRPLSLAMQHELDAWDAGSKGRVACLLRSMLAGFGDMVDAIDARIELPQALLDARRIGPVLLDIVGGASSCPVPAAADAGGA